MQKEATVIMASCRKQKRVFGIRAEKIKRDWHFTWAFSIDEKAAKREGYDSTSVNGNIIIDNEYPGCPYCDSKSFIQCGNCHKISCWDYETAFFKCPVCGNSGEVYSAESFENIKGGGY
jgi:hypothetical protein